MVKLKKLQNVCLVLILITSLSVKAQLITNNSLTPAQLVQTVLLGSGVTASNITYNGASIAIGDFDGSLSNIGLPAGVLMTCGDITNAVGPNNASGSSTGNSLPGDPDLDLIMSPTLSYDASILEFDFVPTSDTVKFRYVFGSEEYMEFVSTTPGGINDGFGFFISGPGITGPFSNSSKNIALIPGTTLPVTMFNLNLNSNGAYYFDNGDGFGSGTAPDGQTVQYDGFTVPLTAITEVICGQTYHIKIAIADGGDGILDSGVFLEAGSFASGGGTTITTSTNFGGTIAGNDTLIYEGCGFASLLIKRSAADTATAQTFHYSLIGTAINGTDYDFLSDSVTFAAGQDSTFVVINSIADTDIEGTETVTMELYSTSTCGGNDTVSKTIYIIDTPPLKVSLNDDTALVCPVQNLFIKAQTNGGVAIGSYRYTWTNYPGSTKDTLHVNPLSTTSYIVTVTDSCGNTASDTCTISFTAYTPMQLTLNNDTTVCGGQSVLLDANVTGGLPVYNFAWTPNVTSMDSVTVTPSSTTTYILSVTDACGYNLIDTVEVDVDPINAAFDYVFATNQTVTFNNLSSNAIAYYWNFGDSSEDSVSTDDNPEHYYATDGSYTTTLVAENQNGCRDTVDMVLDIIPDFYFYFPNSFTPNKNDKNEMYTGYGSGVKSYRMRIFDRWGQLVFESNDMLVGWDGTYKGSPVARDSYVCVFDLESYAGKRSRRMGNVTVIR
jgi:gliding motility-associated-like protein